MSFLEVWFPNGEWDKATVSGKKDGMILSAAALRSSNLSQLWNRSKAHQYYTHTWTRGLTSWRTEYSTIRKLQVASNLWSSTLQWVNVVLWSLLLTTYIKWKLLFFPTPVGIYRVLEKQKQEILWKSYAVSIVDRKFLFRTQQSSHLRKTQLSMTTVHNPKEAANSINLLFGCPLPTL